MTTNKLIEVKNAIPRIDALAFSTPICWTIENNQHWAIIGANGAGKTLLVDILTGKYALRSGEIRTLGNVSVSNLVKTVAFRDIYSLADIQNSYYQQRWNAGDEHEAPTVSHLLAKGEKQWVDTLITAFGIEDLVDKPINLLSSGELRKTLIVKSLLAKPRILVLDNPFIGLDTRSREMLNDVLTNLSSLGDLQIVLILSNPKDVPAIITHILPMQNKTLLPAATRQQFEEDTLLQQSLFEKKQTINISILTQSVTNTLAFGNALLFHDIHIRYGTRTILRNLDWQVKRGEKWALLGENGSGKSTLLSLVSGDNPQAYSNNITLFDRKRGTGESIWDIKKHIGYISPEMHLYYLKNVPCIDVVGSGFFDTIGLYRKCNPEQQAQALKWMQLFGVDHLSGVSFLNVSTGEQRLVLLARVFVKNPQLLILDEPLHGLDVTNKSRIKKIVEEFCTPDKALIYVTHYEDEIPDIVTKQLVLTKRN